MRHVGAGYQTRSLMFSDGETIKPTSKTHKPADSYAPVGNDARCCSLREVTLSVFKHASLTVWIWRQSRSHTQCRKSKNRGFWPTTGSLLFPSPQKPPNTAHRFNIPAAIYVTMTSSLTP